MNIYKVVWSEGSQDYNRFLSFLVVCETEEQARNTHPNAKPAIGSRTNSEYDFSSTTLGGGWPESCTNWIPYKHRAWLEVLLVGAPAEGIGPGVLHTSFLQG